MVVIDDTAPIITTTFRQLPQTFPSPLYSHSQIGSRLPQTSTTGRLLPCIACDFVNHESRLPAASPLCSLFLYRPERRQHLTQASASSLSVASSSSVLPLPPAAPVSWVACVGVGNKDRSRRVNSKRRISKTVRVRAMRAVVQRVASASVEVEGRIVSEIGPGLLVLVGIHDSDSDADADYICRKVLNMRLFPNETTGKAWDHSVMQKNYQVLLVSQFTLYGFLKGNKPDFHVAMAPQRAKPFYASLVERFRNAYNSDAIKDGVFGAMMKVNLVNDGPVTMQLDSQSPKSTVDAAES